MIFKSFRMLFMLCLFYVFEGYSSIFAMTDPMADFHCQRLNQQAGRQLYSPHHLHYDASGTFPPRLEDFPTPINAPPLFYKVQGVALNETPLLKREDHNGKPEWRCPLYDAPGGNQIPVSVLVREDAILENFSRTNFLSARRRPISMQEFTILQQNPDVYLEQDGENYFLCDPMQFNVFMGEQLITVSAKQVGHFFTDHTFSFESYKSKTPLSQNLFSFKVYLHSTIYGPITLDMDASFDKEFLCSPLMPIYALNDLTGDIDLFIVTRFPPPFNKQYVLIDPLTSEPSPIPTPLQGDAAASAEEPLEEDEDEDDDENEDGFVDVKVEVSKKKDLSHAQRESSPPTSLTDEHLREEDDASGGLAQAQQSAASAHTPEPTHAAPSIPVTAPENLRPFKTEIHPSRIPELFYFSQHAQSEDSEKKEEDAYYTTVDNLRFLLSSKGQEDRVVRAHLLNQIQEAVSRRITKKSTFFNCHIAGHKKPAFKEFRKEDGSIGRAFIKGICNPVQERRYVIDEAWRTRWEPRENDEAFNAFLSACCQFLGHTLHLEASQNKEYVKFNGVIPPTGFYVERQRTTGTTWESPNFSADEHHSYGVEYGTRLFFTTKNATELEGYYYSLDERSLSSLMVEQNVSSLLFHDVEMTPERAVTLLKILRNAPSLVHLTINGSSFHLGMLSELHEALRAHTKLETVELSNNAFQDIDNSSQSLRDLLAMFTRGISLKTLTLSEKHGVSIHCSAQDNFHPRAPFAKYLPITKPNINALWSLAAESIHTGVDSVLIEEIHRGKFFGVLPKEDLPSLIAGLPQWSHLKHLSFIRGLKDEDLPPNFFKFGLMGFEHLETLNLSKTTLAPHEGGYDHLRVLGTNCPNLRTLVLVRSFRGPLDLKTLLPGLRELGRLTTLDLSFNQISPQENDPNTYAPFSDLPPHLSTLRMAGCFKGQVPLYLIETILKRSERLRHFDISENPFNWLETTEDQRLYVEFINLIQDLKRSTLTLHIGYEFKPASQQSRRSIPLYLQDEEPIGDKLIVSPHNIKIFLRLLFKNPPKMKGIEFQNLVLNQDDLAFVRSVLHTKFPKLENIRMVGCFQSWEQFLETCKMIYTLGSIRELDISENPFDRFSSYDEFKDLVKRTLLTKGTSLSKVIFTGQEGERIEWTSRIFMREKTTTESPQIPDDPSRESHPHAARAKGPHIPDDHPQEGQAVSVKVETTPAPDDPSQEKPFVPKKHEKSWTSKEIHGFFISPAINTLLVFDKNISNFGYTENLLFLHRLYIDNVPLSDIGISLIGRLKALPDLKALALRNCFKDMESDQLTSFFGALSTLSLKKLDITGHIFHHDEFESIISIILNSVALRHSLEEISLCVPKRENKVVKRGVIGTVVSAGAAVVGGAVVTYFTAGVGTVPYVAAVSGSGGVGGVVSGASGYIANFLKRNRMSEQCITALMPFVESHVMKINVYNVRRKPKGLQATKDFLEKLTKETTRREKEFNLFRETSN